MKKGLELRSQATCITTCSIHSRVRQETSIFSHSFKYANSNKLRGGNSQAVAGQETTIYEDALLLCPYAASTKLKST